jgi:hypothetical protein
VIRIGLAQAIKKKKEETDEKRDTAQTNRTATALTRKKKTKKKEFRKEKAPGDHRNPKSVKRRVADKREEEGEGVC